MICKYGSASPAPPPPPTPYAQNMYVRREIRRNELYEEGQTITRGRMHHARNSDRLYFCRRRLRAD